MSVGQNVAPVVTEEELSRLGITKALALAPVAKKGLLTSELVKQASDQSLRQVREKVHVLLGRAASRPEPLRIDTHTAAEAALLMLGKLLSYKTYTPDRGKTYRGQKLAEIATLTSRELRRLVPEENFESVKRIDVIWVNREFFFFEVEHTKSITEALLRMSRVSKVTAKFYIVAPPEQRPRFDREIDKEPFKGLREKCRFVEYPKLEAFYEKAKAYFPAYESIFG